MRGILKSDEYFAEKLSKSDEEKKEMLLILTKLKDERVNLMITGCTGCGKS